MSYKNDPEWLALDLSGDTEIQPTVLLIYRQCTSFPRLERSDDAGVYALRYC